MLAAVSRSLIELLNARRADDDAKRKLPRRGPVCPGGDSIAAALSDYVSLQRVLHEDEDTAGRVWPSSPCRPVTDHATTEPFYQCCSAVHQRDRSGPAESG